MFSSFHSLWLFRVSQAWLICNICLQFFCSSFNLFFSSQIGVHKTQKVFMNQGSRVNSSFSISIYFYEHLTSLFNKRQRKRDNMPAMRRRKLHRNWWLVRFLCSSSELNYQKNLAGDTLNIFLLTGISDRNIFFMKKKKNIFYKATLKISLLLQTQHKKKIKGANIFTWHNKIIKIRSFLEKTCISLRDNQQFEIAAKIELLPQKFLKI